MGFLIGFAVCYVMAGGWIMVCFHRVNGIPYKASGGALWTTFCFVLFWPIALAMED